MTDPNLSSRIRRLYNGEILSSPRQLQITDVRLLLVGRHFLLPDSTWFILGRNEAENDRLAALAGKDDWLMRMAIRPGPAGLLRRAAKTLAGTSREKEVCRQAAGIIIHYGRKIDNKLQPAEIEISKGSGREFFAAEPPLDEQFKNWQQ